MSATTTPYVKTPLTADGTSAGVLTVASTFALRVGATVYLSGTSLETLALVIEQITSATTFLVKDPLNKGFTRFNCSAYTVALAALVTQPEQTDYGQANESTSFTIKDRDGDLVDVSQVGAYKALKVDVVQTVNSGGGTGTEVDVTDRVARVLGNVAVSNFPATQAVTGPLTDTQLRASSVPVSIAGVATEATLLGIKTGTDRIPASPSQEHITAVSPSATRLSDGTAFYKATTPADTQPVSLASSPLPAGAATQATLAAILTELVEKTEPAQAQTVAGTVAVSNFPAVQPVSATTLPLPTGASTAAKQDTQQTRLDLLAADATVTARLGTLGQKTMVGSTPVVIASDQSTLAVSAASLPLPAGASTSAAQATQQVRLDLLATEVTLAATNTSLGTDGLTPPVVAGTGVRGWLRAIYDRLVAGIGRTWVLSSGTDSVNVGNFPAVQPVNDNGGSLTVDSPQLPAALTVSGSLKSAVVEALPTGANAIGSITNTDFPSSAANTKLDTLIAKDFATQTTLATRASETTAAAILADLDAKANNTAADPGVVKILPASAATLSEVAASAVSVVILAANASRRGFKIHNAAPIDKLYLRFDASAASTTSFNDVISPGETYVEDVPVYPGEIRGIWTGAPTGKALVTEKT